ncbi:MAG: Methionine aminopeptidase [Microgenomates group bacterium GW2011_GWF2_47_9]|nr:MAG: Methionine aminopeptidase [Microgenomates group bacterium GW2011_GWF2_47_9]
MKEGGAILGAVRSKLYSFVEVGVTPLEIEEKARALIKEYGGEPSFTKVPGYHHVTCVNLNSGIVHGLPVSDVPFVDGDLVTVDCGVYFKGFHTDAAFSKVVGTSTPAKDKFLAAGLASLKSALSVIKPGSRIGDISLATQTVLENAGYYPTRELTGHGIGRELHEEPMIPNLLSVPIESTPELVLGQTLAIENIYADVKPRLSLEKDGWTINVINGKLSAVFEETVQVTEGGCSILTTPTLFQII